MEPKSKIRILFTIPNFDTAGSGKAMLNLATGLDPSVFEAHICCLHEKGAFFTVVKQSGLPVHVFDYLVPMKPRIRGFINTWKISRRFKKINPHLIHSFNYSSDYSEVLASRMAGIKWVFSKKNMMWGSNAWKLRSRLAHGIIAMNTDMLKMFFPGWKKVSHIPRGVNTREFTVGAALPELKSSLGLNDKRVLITVANLVPIKGVEILLQAFNTVSGKYQNTVLLIVGDDQSSYATELKALAETMGLKSRVLFLGKKLNVNEYLNLAEIIIFPTLGRGEGSPVALMEAMSSSRYILASDVPGSRDVLKGFQELLFEAGNAAALSEKLDKSLGMPAEELIRKGKELRAVVENGFTIQREITSHEEFYKKIVKG